MTDKHFSLVNVGDLSKPADTLIKKISNAIGILYEPTRIRKRAKAEGDAEKIKALARADLTALEERAIERLVRQEARRQQNIEEITTQAVTQLGEDAHPEGLDEDWVAHFFMKCEDVSDKDMQSLWGKILAGEATRPATFSKRTIEFVSTMDKRDAEMFTKFGQFVWNIYGPTSILLDLDSDVFKESGVTFADLKHLDSIGLIMFSDNSSYQLLDIHKILHAVYFGSFVSLEFQMSKDNTLQLGRTLLTDVGKQLFSICGASRNEMFFTSVLDQWRRLGIIVNSV